ncbi:lipopolysaccharide biosynthesis protein [Gemella sp.]
MKKSRTDYATLNTSIALAIQPFQALIGFVSRTVFLNILGVTYLGLNNYLSSLVSMLSLAELGIGGAMTYALYSPLARKDHGKINAFMILFKRLYRMIGIGIFIFGTILAVFLPYIIKDYPVNREVYIVYFLFVFNSASSYFFSYKRTLLYVDQRNYVMTSIDFGLSVLRAVLQIGVLIYTKNFVIYLLVGIFMNILGNLIMSNIVDRMYDYLYNEEITSITREEKSKFVKNVKGNIVGRIGETIVFQTDSLLMGAYISLTAIGLYGNYIFVLGFLSLLVNTTINPVVSSIGNLIHSEDTTLIAKINFIKKFQFIVFSMVYLLSMGFLIFINPFITIWLGKDFLFDIGVVILIVVNFFLTNYRRPALILISIYGLSYEQNKKVLVEIILNIVLSLYYLVVLDLGVAGILLGTICSTVLTCIWYEPYSAFKYGIKSSAKEYFKTMVKHFTVFTVSIVCIILLDFFVFSKQEFIVTIFMKILLYIGLFSIYIYLYRNHEVGKLIVRMMRKILFLNRLRRK